MAIDYRNDPFPAAEQLAALSASAWGSPAESEFSPKLALSLAHVGAYDGETLVGFVNVAWDGGGHAFILDTMVDRQWQRQGIATRLVQQATRLARERGAVWLHVDFEPHLTGFYRRCGFVPTEAGLIKLRG